MENESNQNGWIKLHRKLADHPMYCHDSEWVHLWVHLLICATHRSRRVMFGGQEITLQPGQLTTGRLRLAKETGIHEQKVKRILTRLKQSGQIDQQVSNACS
ncbi:MAG: hypothetical protein AB1813_16410, partial [Verrucomicrobiota bacterium]